MRERFLRLNDAVYIACAGASGLSLVAMGVIIPWSIFTRYVLGTGSQWPEPVSIQLMVTFAFLSAAACVRAGAHISVALVTDRMPPAAKRVLAGIVRVLMLAVSAFMFWYGARLSVSTMGQPLGQLPWLPVGLTYLPVPVSGAASFLFVLEDMLCGSQARRPVVMLEESRA